MVKYKLLLFLLLSFSSFGQNLNKSRIAVRNFCDTIPFVYERGKMIVEVAVDKKTRRFIFDTGAPLLVSADVVSSLGLPVIGSGEVTDVGANSSEEKIVKMPILKLGSIPFENAVALVFDRGRTGLLDCFNIDGLIGSTLFKHCIVQINLAQKIIILTDRRANLDIDQAFESDIKLDKTSKPFISLNFGGRTNLQVMFDSGSDKFLPLSMDGFSRLTGPVNTKVLNEGYGSTSSGLYGAGKAGIENRAAVGDVLFGGHVIKDVITTVSERKNKDAIGMGLARYGIITIDYLKKKFYFKPYADLQTYQSPPFFGFAAQLIDGFYTVSAVYKNSVAEKSGLKNGYRITKINSFDLSANDRESVCELFLSDYMEKSSMTISFLDYSGTAREVTLKGE
jgi:hypothetical protein